MRVGLRTHVLGVLLASILGTGAGALDFNTPLGPEEAADALLAVMDDQEALAQTFMLGWVGADPSPLILDWIRERNIGGVKIFGWNTDDTRRLAATVGSLQKAALESPLRIPLLVSTDQEGGWIRHVKGATSETPGNMAIGASGFPRDAYLSGYYIGKELAALGINMNFAPTVDIFSNRESVIIGPRSFGDDPVTVGILGAAFARGLDRAGIIATAKHFPGHGGTALDSHGVLPKIDVPFETLWNRELIPYRMLIREGVPAIMSGHLAFPLTPARHEPASLNRWFLTDLLRSRMGYTGLIITDDLMMYGATIAAGNLSRAAKLALEAGNDIIMLSKTPSLNHAVWTYLVQSMEREKAFRDRVRDAARRVLVLKLTHLRGSDAPPFIPDLETLHKRVPYPKGRPFFLDLAARSVTVVSGGGSVIPLRAERAGRVLLAGAFEDFLDVGEAAYPGAGRFRLSFGGAGRDERAELRRRAEGVDTVILCLANPYSLSLLQSLRDLGVRVVVVSVLSPVHLERAPWVDGSVAIYSYSRESFIAAFSALLGNIDAQGRLPFNTGRN